MSGKLINLPKYRTSPAGIETAHFKLWHESLQEQLFGKLDLKHKVEFSIMVSVAQHELITFLKTLNFIELTSKKIWLEVRGYLSQRLFANGDQKLVLHANVINLLS